MSLVSSVRGLVAGALSLFFSATIWSASPTLPGPNVIWFPPVDMPFLQSYLVISSGEKLPDGGCRFPLDSEASPDVLLSGQHWVTVQRAFDPDTCQELLEKGVIDLNVNPEAKKLIELPDSSSANTFIQTGALGSPEDAASANSSKSGKVRVWHTDKKNPIIETVNSAGIQYDGFILSSNQIEATYSQSDDCQIRHFEWRLTEQLGLIGWYRDSTTTLGLTFGCGYGLVSVSAVHANKTQFEPFFDCRDVLKISYSPMRLRVNLSGPNTLEGSVAVTGDFNRCGEYAQRFQDGPY